jgi:hypothetical protein
MNREEFFAKLAPLDEAALKKALWNLYWRGSAQVRERIEGEIEPAEKVRRQRDAAQPPIPGLVLAEVTEFAELARAGAYLGGDRRVSPRERTRWRVTFRRLAGDAQAALRAEDARPAEAALELLIDVACETRGCDYFRSEDPVEAARFVVSDAAALLWGTLLDRYGFAGFADRAAPQLVRWESRYGWTRSGWGQLSSRETSLASVLVGLLRTPDMWTGFAERYLGALDQAGHHDATAHPRIMVSSGSYSEQKWRRKERGGALAAWHLELLDRLDAPDTSHLLDTLVKHPAIEGPERTLLAARLAQRCGDEGQARARVGEVLKELPGHREALAFAGQIGAPPPTQAAGHAASPPARRAR